MRTTMGMAKETLRHQHTLSSLLQPVFGRSARRCRFVMALDIDSTCQMTNTSRLSNLRKGKTYPDEEAEAVLVPAALTFFSFV
jgi:hypothetical protein